MELTAKQPLYHHRVSFVMNKQKIYSKLAKNCLVEDFRFRLYKTLLCRGVIKRRDKKLTKKNGKT